MVAFNFKKQFIEAVEEGTKRQTIRAHRKDGRQPKVGDKLQLYYGMRTKKCRLLRVAECLKVVDIYINDGGVFMNDTGVGFDRETIAKEDGFDSWREMHAFFVKEHGLPFEGVLVKW